MTLTDDNPLQRDYYTDCCSSVFVLCPCYVISELIGCNVNALRKVFMSYT
jgi:hypothetical protein